MTDPTPLPLTAVPLDRAGEQRSDPAFIAAQRVDPRASLVLFAEGQPLLADHAGGADRPGLGLVRLNLAAAGLVGAAEPPIFLGLEASGPLFAAAARPGFRLAGTPLEGLGGFEEVRMIAGAMHHGEAGIAGLAKSLLDWHGRHGFCARCGARTEMADGGAKRRCPSCAAEHFPRVDPVAIMLAVCEDRCLLGRQKNWPSGFFSALAGFIEPGESLEEGCLRELREEAGVIAQRPRYLFCQPWPYPSSLMLALIAPTDRFDCRPDAQEIEELIWVTRTEARAMLAGAHPSVRCPGPHAIAHHLIKAWIAEEG